MNQAKHKAFDLDHLEYILLHGLHNKWNRWTKLRFAILYPAGLAAVVFAQCSDRSLRAGIGSVIAGLLIRLWANGYAIKTEKLTTCGPYSIVRNPLYIGSALIILGFIIILNLHFIGITFFCIWIAIYLRTIHREEKALEKKFGDEFRAYAQAVPALFPTIFPYKRKEHWNFSIHRVIENKEYKVCFWIIISAIFFYIKEKLGEHEPLMIKQWILIALAAALALADIAGEVIKWKKKYPLNH